MKTPFTSFFWKSYRTTCSSLGAHLIRDVDLGHGPLVHDVPPDARVTVGDVGHDDSHPLIVAHVELPVAPVDDIARGADVRSGRGLAARHKLQIVLQNDTWNFRKCQVMVTSAD